MKKPALVISVGLGAILLVWMAVLLPGSETAPATAPVEVPDPSLEEPVVAEPSAEPVLPTVPDAPTAPAAAPPQRQRVAADERPPEQGGPEKMGPIDQLKAAYQSDARDPEAGATEERIREHLKQEDIPAELVRQVSCVKSACKLEMRWTSDNRHGYMIAMMNLVSHISQEVAAEPLGESADREVHSIDVYVSRIVPPYTPTGSN